MLMGTLLINEALRLIRPFTLLVTIRAYTCLGTGQRGLTKWAGNPLDGYPSAVAEVVAYPRRWILNRQPQHCILRLIQPGVNDGRLLQAKLLLAEKCPKGQLSADE